MLSSLPIPSQKKRGLLEAQVGMDYPKVDILTVTYNSVRHLGAYFEGLRTLNYPPERLRLIAVDNASRDGTRESLREGARALAFPSEVFESEENVGFGAACNLGAARGFAPFILLLNPDARLMPDTLRQLAGRVLGDERIGAVDAVQEPFDLGKWSDPASGETDWCSGGAALVRREAFRQVGGFDPFFFLYCEDVDLSWRMWLGGWRCVTERGARVRHDTTEEGGALKPVSMYYSIRNSFAMRLIYDTPRGAASHFVRGLRYLASPRTEGLTRRAVLAGFWLTARGLPHLLRRRRAAQGRLASSGQRERFVFTEWFYGRFTS